MKKTLIIFAVIFLIFDIGLISFGIMKKNGMFSGDDASGNKEKTYRLVKVESISGDVALLRDKEEEEIFEDMRLIPKDQCETKDSSQIELLVDEDKHILAMENTIFTINAKGDEDKGSVTIELVKGESLYTIDNKLSDKDEFNVNTSNASLSVRGTQFLVNYDEEKHSTYVEVREGTVWVSSNGEELILEKGDSVTVFDDRIASYVSDEKYEELTAKLGELDNKREEAFTMVTEYEEASSNYTNNEEIVDTLGKIQTMRDSEIPSLFQDRLPSGDVIQEEISESLAEEYIAAIDEAIGKYDELEQLVTEGMTLVEEFAAENGWREAYKAFVANPSSVIKDPIYDDTYGFANFAGDAYPELIIWGDTSKSGNGRYGSVYFVSYSDETGMYELASTGCEINTGFGVLDNKLLMRTIENGPGTYTVYSYTVTKGNVKSNGKVSSGKANNISWPDGAVEIPFYSIDDTSPIDSYELTDVNTADDDNATNTENSTNPSNGSTALDTYSISDVVGTWEDSTHYVTVTYTFNDDGTGYVADLYSGKQSYSFTYSIDGDKLVYNTGKTTHTFTISNGKLKDSSATYTKK